MLIIKKFFRSSQTGASYILTTVGIFQKKIVSIYNMLKRIFEKT